MLSKLKLKNVVLIEHLNINSSPDKFDQLKVVIENDIIVLIFTETNQN